MLTGQALVSDLAVMRDDEYQQQSVLAHGQLLPWRYHAGSTCYLKALVIEQKARRASLCGKVVFL